jgi:hypothetical protein
MSMDKKMAKAEQGLDEYSSESSNSAKAEESTAARRRRSLSH